MSDPAGRHRASAKRAPAERPRNEDEFTYVLEGEVGVRVGDEVTLGRPGDLILRPRGIWHAFRNPGHTPARALEIISPPGFESYFEEIAPLLPPNREGPPEEQALGAVLAKYEIEMDMSSMPELIERHGLAPPERPA